MNEKTKNYELHQTNKSEMVY